MISLSVRKGNCHLHAKHVFLLPEHRINTDGPFE